VIVTDPPAVQDAGRGPYRQEVAGMPEFAWLPNVVKRLILWVEPAGGQSVARQNAWSSLVVDVRRRAERVEAERAAEVALLDRQRHAAAV
jgi:hypothetical protein